MLIKEVENILIFIYFTDNNLKITVLFLNIPSVFAFLFKGFLKKIYDEVFVYCKIIVLKWTDALSRLQPFHAENVIYLSILIQIWAAFVGRVVPMKK